MRTIGVLVSLVLFVAVALAQGGDPSVGDEPANVEVGVADSDAVIGASVSPPAPEAPEVSVGTTSAGSSQSVPEVPVVSVPNGVVDSDAVIGAPVSPPAPEAPEAPVVPEVPEVSIGTTSAGSSQSVPEVPVVSVPDVKTPQCNSTETLLLPGSGCLPTVCSEGCPNSNVSCAAVCQDIPERGVCACRKGLFRLNGNCVEQSVCDQQSLPVPSPSCEGNEELVLPGSGCLPTACSEGCPNSDLVCTAECGDIPAGGVCACRKGFFRQNGKCVEQSVCDQQSLPVSSPTCERNEELVLPGSGCLPIACREGCPRRGVFCPEICDSIPAGGACVCSIGFFRLNGKCVDQKTCNRLLPVVKSPKCKHNEILIKSATECLPTHCNQACPHSGIFCPADCHKIPVEGACACRKGTYKLFGRCVNKRSCEEVFPPPPPLSCGQDEVLLRSATGRCLPTECSEGCPNSGLSCIDSCEKIPEEGVCICRSGLFRLNGNCVNKRTCRRNFNYNSNRRSMAFV